LEISRKSTAKLRYIARATWRRDNYLPDQQKAAVKLLLRQARTFSDTWNMVAPSEHDGEGEDLNAFHSHI
jgi:hypothetical protein